ncbi:hypothetical protein D3C84_991640 [compost metagenome]
MDTSRTTRGRFSETLISRPFTSLVSWPSPIAVKAEVISKVRVLIRLKSATRVSPSTAEWLSVLASSVTSRVKSMSDTVPNST